MTGSARTLPARPSLRHLKVEARRRVKSGEFPALFEAQLAIAREHGQSTWAALKALVCGRAPHGRGTRHPAASGLAPQRGKTQPRAQA
jgi:hypothetical protein